MRNLPLVCGFLTFALLSFAAGPKVHAPPPASATAEDTDLVASIHPSGNPTAMQRAVMAKISFGAALKAALTAVPGQVLYGELVVEDGDLEYEFQIINAARKLKDITVDAGDGKILEISDGEDK